MRKKLGLAFLLSLGIVATTTLGFSSWVIPALSFSASPSINDSSDAVAYVRTDGNSDRYFWDLGKAINFANSFSSASVYVIPGVGTRDDPILLEGGRNVSLGRNIVTLSSGVSLYLPFEGENYEQRGYDANGFADSSWTKVQTNLKSNVLLASETDLYIESGANLFIGGQVGDTGSNVIGVTSGSYAQLLLGESSSIICNGGNIQCLGYIKPQFEEYNGDSSYAVGESLDGVLVHINSGTLISPIAFYDFRGGALLSGLKSANIFPLSVFDLPNISCPLLIESSATYKVYLEMYSGSMKQHFQGDFIFSGEGGVIDLADGASLLLDYTPSLTQNVDGMHVGLTYNDYSSPAYIKDGSNGNEGRTKVVIDGGATFNNIKAKLYIEVSTEGMFVPFSWKWDITAKGGDFIFNVNTKFLPGADVLVEKDANLFLNGMTIFYQNWNSSIEASAKYPSNLPAAKLVNNGNIHINGSFGGIIETSLRDAEINLESGASFSTSSPEATTMGANLGIIQLVNTENVVESARAYLKDREQDTNFELKELSLYQGCGRFISDGSCFYPYYKLTSVPIEVAEYVGRPSGEYVTFTVDSNGQSIDMDESGGTVEASGTIRLTNLRNVAYAYYSGLENEIYFPDASSDIITAAIVEGHSLIVVPASPVSSMNGQAIGKHYTVTMTVASSRTGNSWSVVFNQTDNSDSNSTSAFSGIDVKVGDLLTASLDYHGKDENTGTWSTNAGFDISGNSENVYTFRVLYGAATNGLTVAHSFDNSVCVIEGTLITMADGSQKPVEDIVRSDMLMVFNHETGRLDKSPVFFVEGIEEQYDVMTLTFDDGTTLGFVNEHGLFDAKIKKYVYVNEINYESFLGDQFLKQDGSLTTLQNVSISEKTVKAYHIASEYHLNVFTNGILGINGSLNGLFNIFDLDDSLKYDEEKKASDIEKYGLFTYEDFKDWGPYELYEKFPASYLKVSLGKGLTTLESLARRFEEFRYLL